MLVPINCEEAASWLQRARNGPAGKKVIQLLGPFRLGGVYAAVFCSESSGQPRALFARVTDVVGSSRGVHSAVFSCQKQVERKIRFSGKSVTAQVVFVSGLGASVLSMDEFSVEGSTGILPEYGEQRICCGEIAVQLDSKLSRPSGLEEVIRGTLTVYIATSRDGVGVSHETEYDIVLGP